MSDSELKAKYRATVDGLPQHLKAFVAEQSYDIYSDRDHAVWRFLLRGLALNLSESAHPVYQEGMRRAGISLERIPRIEEINAALQDMDWQAVTVDGFLPPAVFMEFQALRVLPIAVDMRSFEHMLYTPAPDIVHESAGHAPFIVDVDYAEFLQRFGELGMHAIASSDDIAVYQAVRRLSVIKQRDDARPEQIAEAEAQLEAATQANQTLSEAALLARLHWWTVEYGLVGEVDDYRIFGAGLLSSLGESTNCLDDAGVQKRVLTVDAIDQAYDITTEQPQLYVTQNCRHLTQVLEEFGRQMCVSVGGARSMRTAIEAKTVNTAQFNSGLQVSGVFTDMICDAVDNPIFIKFTGVTQLSFEGKVLPGQGVNHHPLGFSTPIGRVLDMERCLSEYTIDELIKHGIVVGEAVTLKFLSGIVVQGQLLGVTRRRQRNLIFTFDQCTMQDQYGNVLYEPAWGTFDMAVGDSIPSVFGGAADLGDYGTETLFGAHVAADARANPVPPEVAALYLDVRNARTQGTGTEGVDAIIERAKKIAPQDWLLMVECLELNPQHVDAHTELTRMEAAAQAQDDEQTLTLIAQARRNLAALTH